MSGRRTQAERSADTIGRLVDATIESIAEIGYHRTSLGEVCTRSGVSKGGLFRHFESRLDLVVTAASEVARRHMAAFEELASRGEAATLGELLAFARGESRDRANAVWFELLVAARTDPELQERLAPLARSLYDFIEEAAVGVLPDDVPADLARLVATSLMHMFDGESILRHTYPRPELEEERLLAASVLVETLARRPVVLHEQ